MVTRTVCWQLRRGHVGRRVGGSSRLQLCGVGMGLRAVPARRDDRHRPRAGGLALPVSILTPRIKLPAGRIWACVRRPSPRCPHYAPDVRTTARRTRPKQGARPHADRRDRRLVRPDHRCAGTVGACRTPHGGRHPARTARARSHGKSRRPDHHDAQGELPPHPDAAVDLGRHHALVRLHGVPVPQHGRPGGVLPALQARLRLAAHRALVPLRVVQRDHRRAEHRRHRLPDHLPPVAPPPP